MFRNKIAGNFTNAKILKRENCVTPKTTINKNLSYIKEKLIIKLPVVDYSCTFQLAY
jgi:hypothetical protein